MNAMKKKVHFKCKDSALQLSYIYQPLISS